MTLSGFISVPEQATTGGAPIDAFQADAFRRNDVLFEQVMQGLLSSPYMPAGIDGDVTNPDPKQFVNAKTIIVNSMINLMAGVPLIWMAREKITINHTINAKGRGAQSGHPGDFGGSGGGGATAGQPCNMPFSTDPIIPASAAGSIGVGLDALSEPERWKLSRIPLFLPWLKGGAAGAASSATAAGAAGGGVVCLCAPVIELIHLTGKIDASGVTATDSNGGGGGGGLVFLVARQIVNATAGATVLVNGGPSVAGGSGQAGGNGKLIAQTYK